MDDKASAMDDTTDGGFVIAGTTYSVDGHVSTSYGNGDIWIIKITSEGDIQWEKTLGGSRDDQVYSIEQTTDGGYIVAGFTRSDDHDVSFNHSLNNDCWVIKLDISGNIVWEKTYGGTDRDFGIDIKQTSDNGYVIAGTTYSIDGDITTSNLGNGDCWIIKINSQGDLEWQKTIGTPAKEAGQAILQADNGDYLFLGVTELPDSEYHNDNDILLVRLSESGNIQWQKTFGGPRNDQPGSLYRIQDNGYIICGLTDVSEGDFNADAWVIKIDEAGIIEWQRTYGGSGFDIANKIRQTADDGYIIAGNTMSPDGDVTGWHDPDEAYMDYWILKINTTGDIQWEKAFGSFDVDLATDIRETEDGGYVVVGGAMSPGGDVEQHFGSLSNLDYWIFKISPDMSTPDFAENAVVVYPNPAKSFLNVQLKNELIQTITIRDIAGKYILDTTAVTIDINSLDNGIYILEISSKSGIFYNKFIKN